jgi:DNA-binding response OmpR family regulator
VSAAEAAERAQREFGLSETSKRALEENKGTPSEPESVTARVKGASRRPTGEQVFVLENGQVWVETSTFTAARVQPGDEVTVRKGALGSFLLVTPKRVATHVRRLK